MSNYNRGLSIDASYQVSVADFLKSLQTDDGRQVMAIAHTGELKIAV